MLLNDEQVESRLNSLDNLMNRLNGSSLKTVNPVIDILPEKPSRIQHESIPALPPSVDELIADAEDKIRTAKINGLAKDVLETSLLSLKYRLEVEEVDNPTKLSRIATDMSKIISNNNQVVDNGPKVGSVIIYKPVMVNENHYEALQVAE